MEWWVMQTLRSKNQKQQQEQKQNFKVKKLPIKFF